MEHPSKERSFVIIKPDGIQRGLIGDIIKRFESAGLKLIGMRMVLPTEEQCWAHYNKDDKWFEEKGGNSVRAR